MALKNVQSLANYPIDLDDGRILAPGDYVEGVDVDAVHNANLIDGGLLQVFNTKRKNPSPVTPNTPNPEENES